MKNSINMHSQSASNLSLTPRLDSANRQFGYIEGSLSVDMGFYDDSDNSRRGQAVVEPVGMSSAELIDWYHEGFTVRQLLKHKDRLSYLYGQLAG